MKAITGNVMERFCGPPRGPRTRRPRGPASQLVPSDRPPRGSRGVSCQNLTSAQPISWKTFTCKRTVNPRGNRMMTTPIGSAPMGYAVVSLGVVSQLDGCRRFVAFSGRSIPIAKNRH